MGAAIARALIDTGGKVSVWNRSAAKTAPLSEAGAIAAATATEAVTAHPIVIVCVADYAAARSVVEPATTALAEKTLVNLTNGTPQQARELSAWAAAHNIDYLDGGIMAVPTGVGQPGSFVLYSGDERAFAGARRTLTALGNAVYVGPDAGAAANYDLALLSAMYGMFAGTRHAVELVGEDGAPQFIEQLLVPFLTAMAGAVTTDASDSPLSMQATALANIVAASEGVHAASQSHLIGPMHEIYAAGAGAQLPQIVRKLAAGLG